MATSTVFSIGLAQVLTQPTGTSVLCGVCMQGCNGFTWIQMDFNHGCRLSAFSMRVAKRQWKCNERQRKVQKTFQKWDAIGRCTVHPEKKKRIKRRKKEWMKPRQTRDIRQEPEETGLDRVARDVLSALHWKYPLVNNQVVTSAQTRDVITPVSSFACDWCLCQLSADYRLTWDVDALVDCLHSKCLLCFRT